MIKQIMNEVEDWIMSRDNVQANQEDVINLKNRIEHRLDQSKTLPKDCHFCNNKRRVKAWNISKTQYTFVDCPKCSGKT